MDNESNIKSDYGFMLQIYKQFIIMIFLFPSWVDNKDC